MQPHLYRFGPFRLDTGRGILLREGREVPLRPKSFEALRLFVERPGKLWTKDELMAALWPDANVEENNLNQQISALRRALAHDGNGAGFITAVRGRGYRFVAEVIEEAPPLAAPALAPPVVPQSGGRPRRGAVALIGLAAAIALILTLTALALRLLRVAPRPAGAAVRSLAVLPFRPLAGSDPRDYLGLGLADALISRLANLRAVAVRPTAAVADLAREPLAPQAAGRRLLVDAVLDGYYQRRGDRTRLTVQLVNVREGAAIWSAQFEATDRELFGIEDRLAQAVCDQLAARVAADEKRRLARRREVDPAAYEAYLKGRYLWNRRTAPDLAKASQYFEEAIRADPGFAAAYAGLADAYNLLGLEERGEVAARRALALDPDLAEAHAALAIVRLFHDSDWAAAERELKQAISLQPSYASAHHWYAFLHAARGHFDQALAEIHEAHGLDPLSLIIQTDVGQILLYARRFGEAERQLQEVLRLDPGYVQAHRVLAQLYLAESRFPEAERVAQGLGALHAAALARLGERRKAEESVHLAEGAIRPDDPRGGRDDVARAWVSLGDPERALRWLEQMPEARDGNVLFLAVDPGFDPLRRDPRFERLLERVGVGHH